MPSHSQISAALNGTDFNGDGQGDWALCVDVDPSECSLAQGLLLCVCNVCVMCVTWELSWIGQATCSATRRERSPRHALYPVLTRLGIAAARQAHHPLPILVCTCVCRRSTCHFHTLLTALALSLLLDFTCSDCKSYYLFSSLAASMLQTTGTASGFLIDSTSGNSLLLSSGMDEVSSRHLAVAGLTPTGPACSLHTNKGQGAEFQPALRTQVSCSSSSMPNSEQHQH